MSAGDAAFTQTLDQQRAGSCFMQIGVRGLLVQVQNGKREVIWPEEYKTAEPKLPIPAWDKR